MDRSRLGSFAQDQVQNVNVLFNECKRCNMKFETKDALNNHLTKFCKESQYGDQEKLQNRLEDVKRGTTNYNARITRDDLDNYVNGGYSVRAQKRSFGGLPLEEVKGAINAEDRAFEKAKGNYMQQKELDMKNELGNLKKEKNQLRKDKKSEEENLGNLMREVEMRREREIRARVEKEQIKKSMRDLQNKRLNALERQKEIELKKLQSEREALRLKEEEIMDEIQQFRNEMDSEETEYKRERDRLDKMAQEIDSGKNQDMFKIKKDLLQKERGQKIASLSIAQDQLEIERKRILDDLEKVRVGDLSNLHQHKNLNMVKVTNTDVAKMPEHIKAEQAKLVSDMDRLNKLKLDHHQFVHSNLPLQKFKNHREEDKAQKVPQGPLDLPAQHFDNPEMTPRKRTPQMQPPASPIPRREPTPTMKPSMQPAMNEPGPNRARRTIDPPPVSQSVPDFSKRAFGFNASDPAPPRQQPAPSMSPAPQQSPGPPGQTTMQQFPPGMQQTGMPPNPYAMYGMPPGMPPGMPFNPYMMPPWMQQQGQGYQDPETAALKKQLKKLQKQLSGKQEDGFNDNIANALGAIQNRLAGNDSAIYDDQSPEQRALAGLAQQETEDLRALATIPKNSDLYAAKMGHYQAMTEQRMKMEQMLQQQQMERMRRNFQREFKDEDRKVANDQWAQTQKEKLAGGYQPGSTQEGFGGEDSFIVAWDMITGLPSRFQFCQMVYGVYDQGDVKQPPRLVQGVTTEQENEFGNRATFALNHQLRNIAALSTTIMIIEVHMAHQEPATQDKDSLVNIGWTAFDIFTPRRELQEGYWRLPIYKAPTDPNINIYDIRNKIALPNTFLYLRIAPGTQPLQTGPYAMNQYTIPPSHLREGREIVTPPAAPRPQQPTGQRIGSGQVPRQNEGYNPLANNGIAIRIEHLNDYLAKSHLKFNVTIQEGDQIARTDRGEACFWISNVVNALGNTGTQPGGRIPGTNVSVPRLDSASKFRYDPVTKNAMQNGTIVSPQTSGRNQIDVKQDVSFNQNFYFMLNENGWSQMIYVVVQVLERPDQRLDTPVIQGSRPKVGDQYGYETVAWSVYQISNPESRTLNFGTFELNLYHPPVNVPFLDPEQLDMHNGSLKVTIYEPTDARQAMGSKAGFKQPSTPAPRTPPPAAEPFIENYVPQFTDYVYFEKGSGVDFYVDGARFLPDNVSCTKLIVKAMQNNLEKIAAPKGGLPDLHSSVFSPTFGFRMEFRQPSFDPTTIILVSLETIDTKTKEVRIIGYSVINMFLHKNRKQQPMNPNEADFMLNKGCFQLPIYCQEPYRKPPFSMESFKRLELIPTATLLVRIREAAKSDDGLRVLSAGDVEPSEWYIRGVVVPPPKYEDRAYNTSYCVPSNVEKYLYQDRARRSEMSVRDATQIVQQQLGYKVELNDEQMLDWIDTKIQVDPRTPILEMKYFAPYQPRMGFRFAADCIHNINDAQPYTLVYCLNPPGSLYQETIITQDAQFTTRPDWNSSISTRVFLDGFHTYRNIAYDKNLHVVVEVRKVNLKSGRATVDCVGWSILPVFGADGFVMSGIYQIPVFKGAPPSAVIRELSVNSPWEYLMSNVGRRGGLQLLEPMSIICRLVDTQRDGHFGMILDTHRMNYQFIDKQKMQKYAYNAASHAKAAQTKRLKSIIPSNSQPEPFEKRINQTVVQALGFNHITI